MGIFSRGQFMAYLSYNNIVERHSNSVQSYYSTKEKNEPNYELKIKPFRCGSIDLDLEYDQGLHFSVFFLLFVISFVGCSLTALSNKIYCLKLPKILLDFGRHFGTGVIISTAFVHMMMSSISNLTHECTPHFLKSYSGAAPLITMLSVLTFHLIEFLVLDYINSKSHNHSSINQESNTENESHGQDSGCTHSHADILLLTERKVSTYILELGILSHSIFIGLSLGVTSGPHFIPLVIAVVFHQFFEGIGLGARIARLEFHSIIKPLIMVLSFSVTTSIGIGIGIAVHTAYSSSSPTALAVQGIFDAISAGILIYTGLVELLAREISTKSEFIQHPWGVRVLYFFALYLGVAAMAIIGIWA